MPAHSALRLHTASAYAMHASAGLSPNALVSPVPPLPPLVAPARLELPALPPAPPAPPPLLPPPLPLLPPLIAPPARVGELLPDVPHADAVSANHPINHHTAF